MTVGRSPTAPARPTKPEAESEQVDTASSALASSRESVAFRSVTSVSTLTPRPRSSNSSAASQTLAGSPEFSFVLRILARSCSRTSASPAASAITRRLHRHATNFCTVQGPLGALGTRRCSCLRRPTSGPIESQKAGQFNLPLDSESTAAAFSGRQPNRSFRGMPRLGRATGRRPSRSRLRSLIIGQLVMEIGPMLRT